MTRAATLAPGRGVGKPGAASAKATGRRALPLVARRPVSYSPGGTFHGAAPLRVILVRHGDADAEVPEGLEDDARALTARARGALPAHFTALAGLVGTPKVILMSPLVRAVQTATLFARAIGFEGTVKAHRGLFPSGPVGSIETLLGDFPGETVVLVGHQPSMGSAAAHFLGLPSFPKPVNPGAVIGIERPDDGPTAGRFLFYAALGQPVLERLESPGA